MLKPHVLIAAAVATLIAGGGGATASLADDAGFLKGKTVSVIVGFSPGGGYDTYARLVARYFDRHIPGKPTIIVKNMPGASSMKAVKYLYTAAAQDGTNITTFNAGLIVQSMTKPKKVDVDFSRLRFLGSASAQTAVCYFWHAAHVRSVADLVKRKTVVIGATSTRAASYLLSALMHSILGANVKHVTGYPGSAEQRVAIERGELDGGCGAWTSIPKDWLKSGKAVPLLRFTKTASKDMPKLPYIVDLAKTAEEKKILKLVLAPFVIGRPFVMGPAVPEARLKVLRTAFQETLDDKSFLREADRMKRDIIAPMTGAEVETMIRELYATPKGTVKKSIQYIK